MFSCVIAVMCFAEVNAVDNGSIYVVQYWGRMYLRVAYGQQGTFFLHELIGCEKTWIKTEILHFGRGRKEELEGVIINGTHTVTGGISKRQRGIIPHCIMWQSLILIETVILRQLKSQYQHLVSREMNWRRCFTTCPPIKIPGRWAIRSCCRT